MYVLSKFVFPAQSNTSFTPPVYRYVLRNYCRVIPDIIAPAVRPVDINGEKTRMLIQPLHIPKLCQLLYHIVSLANFSKLCFIPAILIALLQAKCIVLDLSILKGASRLR